MMTENVFKFFLNKATAEDVKNFCELNGYCLVIFNEHEFALKRDHNR